jgi:hypothetical protein
MPEGPELKIMSDYINHHSKDRTFTKLYHVEKGNIPVDSNIIENFKVESISNGKELILRVYHDDADLKFSVFMGMWWPSTTRGIVRTAARTPRCSGKNSIRSILSAWTHTHQPQLSL